MIDAMNASRGINERLSPLVCRDTVIHKALVTYVPTLFATGLLVIV